MNSVFGLPYDDLNVSMHMHCLWQSVISRSIQLFSPRVPGAGVVIKTRLKLNFLYISVQIDQQLSLFFRSTRQGPGRPHETRYRIEIRKVNPTHFRLDLSWNPHESRLGQKEATFTSITIYFTTLIIAVVLIVTLNNWWKRNIIFTTITKPFSMPLFVSNGT